MGTTINQRLKEIIDSRGININAYSKLIGVSQPTLRACVEGENKPSYDTIQKIIIEDPIISLDWLIKGEGNRINSNRINYENKGNPYYNVDFTCGFDLVLNDQTTNPEYYIDLLPFNKNGVVWCNASGHSMEPEINNGDIIAIKELKTNIQYLPFGEIYGIVTDEFRTIKKLAKSDKEGYIRLVPTNKSPEFSEQDIPIDIITNIFQVVVSIKKF